MEWKVRKTMDISKKTQDSLIIHDNSVSIKKYLSDLLLSSQNNKFQIPNNLEILLIRTNKEKSVAEKSLDYLGLNNYTVIQKEIPEGSWRSAFKIEWLEEYLLSNSNLKKKYVLYIDSYDSIIQNDPLIAIKLLKENKCKVLFSNTLFDGGSDCMPEQLQWAKDIAPKSAYPSIFLNAGVFIGEWDFLLKVIKYVKKFFTYDNLTREQYVRLRNKGTLRSSLKEFPKGVGSDQVIFRYIHQKFFPEMKIDYTSTLAIRLPSMLPLLLKIYK